MATHRRRERYFHGGVPGLRTRSEILSADSLGLRYNYDRRTLVPGSVPYDPSLVYFTTDLSVAIGFAARYVNHVTGATGGGWVYEVTPSRQPHPDPDFPFHPDVYRMAPRATVRKIVKRNVILTRVEQVQMEKHHLVWAGRDDRMYDEEGYLLPSDEMAARGVTGRMLRAYGRWLPVEMVDAAGIYSALPGRDVGDVLIEDMYARIPALAERSLHPLLLTSDLAPICSSCGYQPSDAMSAIAHQIGEDLCLAIGRGCPPETLPAVLRQLARHGKAARPDEWEWLRLYKTSHDSSSAQPMA
ncbi:hypothetical protein [Nocardioides sp.]|uniref:hypothetical protein n=1 Tax=Nocardioides sp. TaxID=35761 RepID=UPI002B891024|nr:hypothetical protein [Nocardioides sp.]HXH81104.1 hypothetical protein [Nocardioides sp.]